MPRNCEKKKIKGTLAEYVRSHRESVFYGIQKGGSINADTSYPIVSDTPPIAAHSDLIIKYYTNECYLTIIAANKELGPHAYYFQLDEKINEEWRRSPGISNLVTENEIFVNETDGAVARILVSELDGPGTVTLYRTRPSNNARKNFHPFMQFTVLEPSSTKRRNQAIGINKDQEF